MIGARSTRCARSRRPGRAPCSGRASTPPGTSSAPTCSSGWSPGFGPEVAGRTAAGTPALDVPAAVRIALRRAGVDDLDDVDVCTAASPDHFSHRRDGATGRQAVVVVRTA